MITKPDSNKMVNEEEMNNKLEPNENQESRNDARF